jgi:dTDP-4-dehydrorhamnose 3,5-epimerase
VLAGVQIREVKTHRDERGFFREVVRASDPILREGFAQWSHTVSYAGVAKAWHIHERQVDWWYLAVGTIKVALYDARKNSATEGQIQELIMGGGRPPILLKIPVGVAHGYRVLEGPAHLFYIVSNEYDSTDEGRIPHDDPDIGYDWSSLPPIT